MQVETCGHASCSYNFNRSAYTPYCSEYCFLIKDQKIVSGKWPTLTRICNWCGQEYEFIHNQKCRKDSFCGKPCSLASQTLQSSYGIAWILKNNPKGLTASELAYKCQPHGLHMSQHNAAGRAKVLINNQIVIEEKREHKASLYHFNPTLNNTPLNIVLEPLLSTKKGQNKHK